MLTSLDFIVKPDLSYCCHLVSSVIGNFSNFGFINLENRWYLSFVVDSVVANHRRQLYLVPRANYYSLVFFDHMIT